MTPKKEQPQVSEPTQNIELIHEEELEANTAISQSNILTEKKEKTAKKKKKAETKGVDSEIEEEEPAKTKGKTGRKKKKAEPTTVDP